MTIFRGELQLLRWSETSTGGATVTFQLADVGDLNGFKDLTLAKKGMAGQRIAAIMVQVDDDAEQSPAPAAPKTKPGELCIMACTFCADRQFQDWLHAQQLGICQTEQHAKDLICGLCSIQSRKELDTNKIAATRFHTLIREPFLAWRVAQ